MRTEILLLAPGSSASARACAYAYAGSRSRSRTRLRAHALALVVFATAAAACASSSSSPAALRDDGAGAGAGGGGAAPGTSTGTDPGASPARDCSSDPRACTPGASARPGARCVTTIDATVTDPDGRPLAGVPVVCCTQDVCSGAKSDAAGSAHLRLCRDVTAAALKVEGNTHWVSIATPLPASEADGAIRAASLLAVPLPAEGTAFPDVGHAGSVASGGVALTLPADHAVIFPPLDQEPDERLFRAAEVPSPWIAANVDPALGVEIAFGLAPSGTRMSAPAAISLPCPRGWSPGAAVELFVLGLDPAGSYAPYAGWKGVGTGHVTSDGARIESDAGAGLAVLTVVGARRMR
jgi:hypothetical protein